MKVLYTLALMVAGMSAALPGETDSRAIFRDLQPSLVCISSVEGTGSGVVLRADGLIITNYHVVNTVMPLSIEVMPEGRPQERREVFKQIKWIKVHRKQDLALLQLDLEGKSLKAARIAKSDRETVTGDTCFAIGFPFVPGADKPDMTITKGVVSSAKRMLNDLPYIQIDAPINPGNSGGALTNSQGVVIGIPTLKFLGMDRVGMATPLAGLQVDQFVEVSRRQGDPAAAAEMSGLAALLANADVPTAIYLQHQAIALDPSNSQWSTNLAMMYLSLREYDISLAYSKDAIRKEPGSFPARVQLAKVYDLRNEPKEAEKARLAAIGLPGEEKDPIPREQLVEDLARGYLAARDYPRAAYVASWARTFSNSSTRIEIRRLLEEASSFLPKDLSDELAAKRSGHSVDDMDLFVKRAPDSGMAPAENSQRSLPHNGPEMIVSKVTFPDSTKGKLADAPKGVVYHEDRQELEWTPGAFSKVNQVRVLFTLTRPDGTEESYIHTITRK